MKGVRVQYEVKPDYVETNRKNIQAVMDEIKANPIEGMYYSAYQIEGTNCFMHVNFSKDEETMSKINNVKAFGAFRMALKASEPVSPPNSESIDLIGAGYKLA